MAKTDPRNGMLTVRVLTEKNKTINSCGLITPLIRSRTPFRDMGIDICDILETDVDVPGSDILIIDSKYFRKYWQSRKDEGLAALESLRRTTNKLCWFDTGDSTGMVQSQVFPLVHNYYKAQMLRDKNVYVNKLYGGRIYTNYFFENNSVEDSSPEFNATILPDEKEKLQPAWNYGLARGYGRTGNSLNRLYCKLVGMWYQPKENRYTFVRASKRNGLFLRMNLTYDRKTVSFQRENTLELLKHLDSRQGIVSKHRYLRDMRKSRVVVSPFGWGEINIRDFECFASGGLLVKPSMSHIVTFPDYYIDNETYIPVTWSLDNLISRVEDVLLNYNENIDIAIEAHKRFKYFSESSDGINEFVEYAGKLIAGRR